MHICAFDNDNYVYIEYHYTFTTSTDATMAHPDSNSTFVVLLLQLCDILYIK
jgi:hypothetical protein